MIRENGRSTYFASDIAYFLNKLERGFDRAIYVFGADHHGYMARLQAAAAGLGEDPHRLEILLVQFAVLFRFGEKVQMSTRSGQFITLRELREEVSTDAARFFYVMRSHEQHLDFDLDLAKSRSNENPVFYIQYAHARICSVFRNLEQMDERHNEAIGEVALDLLKENHEVLLMRTISRFRKSSNPRRVCGLRTLWPTICIHWRLISIPTTTRTSSWSMKRISGMPGSTWSWRRKWC